MHGTFLNDVQLPPRNVTVIQDEDEVKFGAEVRRGPETFPACCFRVKYDIVSKYVPGSACENFLSVLTPEYRSTNSYKFTESDYEDDEEEDGLEFSDEVGRASSEDDHSIESPVSKVVNSNDPIDLTRDESPILSNRVDLTDDTPVDTPAETPAEIALMGVLAGRPADIGEDASYSNIAVYAGNPMSVNEPSDDEDARFSTDSEDLAKIDESSDSESSSDEKEYGLDEVLDEILDDDVNEDVEESDGEYTEDHFMEEDEEERGTESAERSIYRFANATNDYTVVRLSEPLSADELSADEEDNESDFGLSEAGEEGLKVLRDGGLLQPLPGGTFGQPDSTYQPAHATVDTSGGSTYVSFRQPSPSDAAMVKSQSSTVAPVHASSQALGTSSGKSEFFAAREINKSRFFPQETKRSSFQADTAAGAVPKIANSVPLFGSQGVGFGLDPSHLQQRQCLSQDHQVQGLQHQGRTELGDQTTHNVFGSKSSTSSFPVSQSTSFASANSGMFMSKKPQEVMLTNSAMPRRDECAFLDMPSTTPVSHVVAAPLPDMTSAAIYSAAKDLAASSLPKTSSVLKIQHLCSDPVPPRANLKRKAPAISEDAMDIDHLSNDFPAPSLFPNFRLKSQAISGDANANLKRKSQVISGDANEGLRTWGNGTFNPLHSSPFTVVVSNTESAVAPDTDGPRPAKRFRKFLEKAGYVAIGGVAVGSALFTALIATAPDFV